VGLETDYLYTVYAYRVRYNRIEPEGYIEGQVRGIQFMRLKVDLYLPIRGEAQTILAAARDWPAQEKK
jgi:hypothetical protein